MEAETGERGLRSPSESRAPEEGLAGVPYLLQELLEVLGTDAASAAQELRAERSVSRAM